MSIQAWTPAWKYNIRLVGFMEGGYVKTLEAPAGQFENETIISLGAGLRWGWQDKLSASLDYAHEIDDARADGVGGDKVHLTLYFRY